MTLHTKHLADSSWKTFQRHNLHSHSVCFYFQHYFCRSKLSDFLSVFKRGKSTPKLGAFHSSDIPEFYGFGANPDFIGTDALGKFSNFWMRCRLTTVLCYVSVNFAYTGNPGMPHNPNSLLSAVDWQPWSSSDDHPLLTFIDPAPDVSITFDNFRVPEINLLNDIFWHLVSGPLDTGSMNEAVTVNSDDKTDTRYILRSDEEL